MGPTQNGPAAMSSLDRPRVLWSERALPDYGLLLPSLTVPWPRWGGLSG